MSVKEALKYISSLSCIIRQKAEEYKLKLEILIVFPSTFTFLEYYNLKDFYDWVLSLKPKDVRNKEIFLQALYKIKKKVSNNENQNLKQRLLCNIFLLVLKDSG